MTEPTPFVHVRAPKRADLAPTAVVAAVAATAQPSGVAWLGDVEATLPNVPPKVIRARLAQLVTRGMLDGCACGCRGNFRVLPAGWEALDGPHVLFRGKPMRVVPAAAALATIAHYGQVDKAGAPYIGHPMRVMRRLVEHPRWEVRAAALLHDVVEDTPLTLDDLAPFGAHVVDLVRRLTHLPGVPLERYIEGIRDDPRAVAIKRADVADNTDPWRLLRLPYDTRVRLIAKYARTLALLDPTPTPAPAAATTRED